jgi:hypothetical protein
MNRFDPGGCRDKLDSFASDANTRDSIHAKESFQQHHASCVSLKLLGEILFEDIYPCDCDSLDTDVAGIITSSDNFHSSAETICRALLTLADSASWTYGTVLCAETDSVVTPYNYDFSSWIKSVAYRCSLPSSPPRSR